MRVMVVIKANKESEAGVLPEAKFFTEMANYNEELVKAGVMLAGEGLQPSSKGVRVRFSAGKPAVIDGPFTETKELIAGFWLWRVKSMAEAIEWVKRCPSPDGVQEGEIEIRPLFELSEFPSEIFPPEVAAREQALRDELQRKAAEGRSRPRAAEL